MRPSNALLARSVWKGTCVLTLLFMEEIADNPYRTSHCPVGSPHSSIFPAFLTLPSLPIVRPKAGERVPPIKTQARSATILPNFVGLVFQVHNGKTYTDVRVTEDMVGHKLGEFSQYVAFSSLFFVSERCLGVEFIVLILFFLGV